MTAEELAEIKARADACPDGYIRQGIADLAAEVERLSAILAPFVWQPEERGQLQAGTMEHAMVGWRGRCLTAERKLELSYASLRELRADLVKATGSGMGRV